MAVLAIDTALDACSVAIAQNGAIRAARFALTRAGQAELLLPMIAAALDEAGLPPRALTKIGVTLGPGSFTGTRIGLAAARAMGGALAIPVIGLTTFEALSLAVPQSGPFIAAFDAHKGQIYLQAFAEDRTPLTAMCAVPQEAVASQLPAFTRPVALAGSAADILRPILAAAKIELAEAGSAPVFPEAAKFVLAIEARPAPRTQMPRPIYLHAQAPRPTLGDLHRKMGQGQPSETQK